MRLTVLAIFVLCSGLQAVGCASADSTGPQALAPDSPSRSIRGRNAQEGDQRSIAHPAAGQKRPNKWKDTTTSLSSSEIRPPDGAKTLRPEQLSGLPQNVPPGCEVLLTEESLEAAGQHYKALSPKAQLSQVGQTHQIVLPTKEGRMVVLLSRTNDQRTLIVHQLLSSETLREVRRLSSKSHQGGQP